MQSQVLGPKPDLTNDCVLDISQAMGLLESCPTRYRDLEGEQGRESIEDEPRSERPSVSKTAENVIRVRDLVRSDHRLTPPYLPDLSPCDFFLFPKLKNNLKGHHFGTLENIQMAVTDQLKAVPMSEFHQCYEEWKKRLQRCVASEGSYFEGDIVEL
ncbi:putative transposase [Trichonephila clavipes]|nr:putative transposase [Trichonephila clavipes]